MGTDHMVQGNEVHTWDLGEMCELGIHIQALSCRDDAQSCGMLNKSHRQKLGKQVC